MQENTAAEDAQAFGTSPDDPVFVTEQAHLSEVYAELEKMRGELVRKMEATSAAAARDKLDLLSEISNDFTSDTETSETYASYGAVNSVIDSYNAQQEVTADKLARCRLLLRQPYFAKVALQFKPGQPPKELYIGAAGISDDNYKRLVVDWRSPVAETYYNQSNGATSYVANGRTIHVDLACRRQFDIEADTLHAYFDTTVAIQDALLLESLSHQRTAQMKAITATIQREQNEVVRHEDVPALLVAGIAGSGKTSVLLQRIAYLFYQNRTELDPSEVFLITPNPIFRTYIENVLPDMGERNPETLTWAEFASRVMPLDKAAEKKSVPVGALWRIDEAIANLEFEDDDFRELHHGNVKLLGINQIRKVNAKYRNVPAGPHRATLMREDLENALEARVKQLASGSAVLEELEGMTLNEQLSQFGEPYAPVDEKEARFRVAPSARPLPGSIPRSARRRVVAHRSHWHAPFGRKEPLGAGMALFEDGHHRPGRRLCEIRDDRRGTRLFGGPARRARAFLPSRAFHAPWRRKPGNQPQHGVVCRGVRSIHASARRHFNLQPAYELPLLA